MLHTHKQTDMVQVIFVHQNMQGALFYPAVCSMSVISYLPHTLAAVQNYAIPTAADLSRVTGVKLNRRISDHV